MSFFRKNSKNPKSPKKKPAPKSAERVESLKEDTEEPKLDEEDENTTFDNKNAENTENPENQPKIQIQRNLADLVARDINRRTLLHRACLDQNEALIADVIGDYNDILKAPPIDPERKEEKIDPLKDFVNLKDKFGNSPLLNACSLKLDSENTRFNCLDLLLKNEADVNVRNDRTLWNAMCWAAYHGDEISAKLLMEKGVEINQPDNQGFYPLDIAGKGVANKKEFFVCFFGQSR